MIAFDCKADLSVCLEGISLKCGVSPHKAAIKHVQGDSSEEGGDTEFKRQKGPWCGGCV